MFLVVNLALFVHSLSSHKRLPKGVCLLCGICTVFHQIQWLVLCCIGTIFGFLLLCLLVGYMLHLGML